MGDYLMWPWFERLLVNESRLGVDLSQYPAVSAWIAGMREEPAVKECSLPAEMHVKYQANSADPNSQLIGIDQKP